MVLPEEPSICLDEFLYVLSLLSNSDCFPHLWYSGQRILCLVSVTQAHQV